MIKRIISFFVLAAFATGCSTQNALKLNDTIVKANDDLRVAADDFNKKFEAVSNQDYTGLEPGRQKMVTLIEEKLKLVSGLKADMPGGEEFRNSFMDYYKFEKDIYDTDYKQICLLTGKGDEDKLTEIATKMQEKASKEESMEKNIHEEQEKFAKRNGLKLK